MSIAAIALAGKDDRPEMARLVFASVVPLIGTWVGTVLAFYFARENLQAAAESQRVATESTMSLLGGLAPSTPVTAVMIPVSRISPKQTVADDVAARAKLSADTSLKDLFVTLSGGLDQQVLGWITSSDLARVG